MARYFREQDIDEFRECFYLFARSGQIRTLDELTIIMRSLGMSPTIQELKKYMKEKGGKMSFAEFLEVMHTHSQAEVLPDEVVAAFQAADPGKKVEQIFREANVSHNGQVKYQDFVKIACAPVPDYY
ncbi:calmodulin-like protein 4 isoform X2 [Schistocerca piceifrons]|uniref:calmodulin-like protein 4 isoform X2 n=1 Tax=Schistocerca piceifrons TaxID=274613 RepID=UPI001F5F2641|nr:calmodulin-like protein 4 isoform X2 [Schistocerca piceifrons]